MTKLTKKDYFNAISNYLSEINADVVATVKEQEITAEMVIDFLDKEIKNLAKKNRSNSKANLAKAEENEKLKVAIINFMVENPDNAFSTSDLIRKVPELDGLSTPKVTAILRMMLAEETVKREVVKRVPVFYLMENNGEQ